ncbi:MAG: hypothetical protein ACT4QD_21615 [Acidobacteriota bacterium]
MALARVVIAELDGRSRAGGRPAALIEQRGGAAATGAQMSLERPARLLEPPRLERVEDAPVFLDRAERDSPFAPDLLHLPLGGTE